MPRIDSKRLEQAVSVAAGLVEIRDLRDFPSRAAELMRQLISCDHSGYNAIDVPSGTASLVADPVDVVFEGGPEILARFANQNPLIRLASAGNTTALRLSDHITQRAFHLTDLYDLVYRRVGVEYQLVMQLPPLRRELGRPEEIIGVSLCKSRHDFCDEDVHLLELLRPIMAGTLERLHDTALLTAVSADPEDDRFVLLVDRDGVVAWATTAAQSELDLRVGASVPTELRCWMVQRCNDDSAGSEPAPLGIQGRRFRVRSFPSAHPGLEAVHLTPAHLSSDAAELGRRFGMTRRRAEVLALALEGNDTTQIARRLRISPRTVEKHFEAIYTHLGVSTRIQAVLAALEDLPS